MLPKISSALEELFYFPGLTISIIAGKLTNGFSETVWQNSLSLREANGKRGKRVSDLLLTVVAEAGDMGYPPQNKPDDLEAIMKLTISRLADFHWQGMIGRNWERSVLGRRNRDWKASTSVFASLRKKKGTLRVSAPARDQGKATTSSLSLRSRQGADWPAASVGLRCYLLLS